MSVINVHADAAYLFEIVQLALQFVQLAQRIGQFLVVEQLHFSQFCGGHSKELLVGLYKRRTFG